MRRLDEIPSDRNILDQIAGAKLIHSRGMVSHLQSPALTEYSFEWHPETQKVYAIRLGVNPTIGELIFHPVGDQTTFSRVVEIWIKGYREGNVRRIGEQHG